MESIVRFQKVRFGAEFRICSGRHNGVGWGGGARVVGGANDDGTMGGSRPMGIVSADVAATASDAAGAAIQSARRRGIMGMDPTIGTSVATTPEGVIADTARRGVRRAGGRAA